MGQTKSEGGEKRLPEETFENTGIGDMLESMAYHRPIDPETAKPVVKGEVKEEEPDDVEEEEEVAKPGAAGVAGKADGDSDEEDEAEAEEAEEEAESEGEGTEGADGPDGANELAQLKAENERLIKLLNEGAKTKGAEEAEVPEPKPEVKEQQATQEQVARAVAELSQDEYDELLTDKDKFMSFIMGVAQDVRQKTLKDTTLIVNRVLNTRAIVDGFFRRPDNEDLRQLMPYMQKRAIEVEAQNPGLGPEEVLQKTADLVRQELGRKVQQAKKKAGVGVPKKQFLPGTKQRPNPPMQKRRTADEADADLIEQMANLPGR